MPLISFIYLFIYLYFCFTVLTLFKKKEFAIVIYSTLARAVVMSAFSYHIYSGEYFSYG